MFLDTSGLLCCFDADEARHSAAVRQYDEAPIRMTHNYVLAEFAALCQARGLSRDSSLAFAADAVYDPAVEVLWVDPALHEQAMRLLLSQLDKSYSLCDAISFLVMRQRKITDALTTDHHFTQAGFRQLLSP